MVPKNTIQTDDTEHLMFESQEKIIKPIRNSDSIEKIGFPQATRSIYQALKRGLRRLSGIKRNNSA